MKLGAILLAAALVSFAQAFQQPGILPLRRSGIVHNTNTHGLTTFDRRASLGKIGLAASRRRASPGVHGLRAQADLAASFASGATSLSGAAVLCGVIAFHELGHFLAAKVQGIRINDFSIGFGPKLLGFTDRDGITYSFRLFPLGGFVSFPEGIEEDEEATEDAGVKTDATDGEKAEKKEKVYNFDDPDLIQNRPALQRAFVISAGVIFNMILSYTAIFTSVSMVGVTTPVVMPGVAVPGIADPNGAAARSGLAPGSVVFLLPSPFLRPLRRRLLILSSLLRQLLPEVPSCTCAL